ncbi:MAG: anthranilate phosphoribosyltransferase [Gammaproteobacteria bacterium]|nr:anthranilate phosphoribosyltransferase [Gammaproteobacteria bacterium]
MSAQISEQEFRTARMRSCIQKVATGPEYSKDLSFDEAYDAMQIILSGEADPVQAGIYMIALRMKRETDTENRASLQAIRDTMSPVTVEVDNLVDIADPYDGWVRGLPVSAFVAPVLAACGIPAVSTGLESVGPKHGMNHYRILGAAGIDVLRDQHSVKNHLENPDIGWGYIDQSRFCPALNRLLPLRHTIVKRPLITTLEVLTKPFVASGKTHLMTGYVHKAYPPVYTNLARSAGFDSALIVRGVEGGVTPSLQQSAKCFSYHGDGKDLETVLEPAALGIEQDNRCVPLPAELPMIQQPGREEKSIDIAAASQAAVEAGLAALDGQKGYAYDSLVYASALVIWHLEKATSLQSAADHARKAIDSGKAKAHFLALKDFG